MTRRWHADRADWHTCCAWCADPAEQPARHTEGCDRRRVELAGVEAVIAGE